MADNITTPIGNIPTNYVYVGGAVVALVIGVVWYRTRQQSTISSAADSAINPATGYPFGSAEDAAALADQGNYVNPAQPYAPGGGGGGIPSTVGFATNQQWSQAVISYLGTDGGIVDTSQLSEALGKYLLGAALTVTQVSLVQQAIAVEGYPPVAASNGYPPSINTAPVVTAPPATKPPTVKKPPVKKTTTYVVRSGDTLSGIAQKLYGSASKWTVIYNANKSTIESAAKRHGHSSSDNGHWIFVGESLVIP